MIIATYLRRSVAGSIEKDLKQVIHRFPSKMSIENDSGSGERDLLELLVFVHIEPVGKGSKPITRPPSHESTVPVQGEG